MGPSEGSQQGREREVEGSDLSRTGLQAGSPRKSVAASAASSLPFLLHLISQLHLLFPSTLLPTPPSSPFLFSSSFHLFYPLHTSFVSSIFFILSSSTCSYLFKLSHLLPPLHQFRHLPSHLCCSPLPSVEEMSETLSVQLIQAGEGRTLSR